MRSPAEMQWSACMLEVSSFTKCLWIFKFRHFLKVSTLSLFTQAVYIRRTHVHALNTLIFRGQQLFITSKEDLAAHLMDVEEIFTMEQHTPNSLLLEGSLVFQHTYITLLMNTDGANFSVLFANLMACLFRH